MAVKMAADKLESDVSQLCVQVQRRMQCLLTLRRRYFFEYTEDGWGRFLPHVEYKYTAAIV